MGRYFQTADYKPTIDFLYEPDWALTERVLKTEQDSLDAQRAQLEAVKNLKIQHLGGAADAENAKRILDYYRNTADEYSNAIESNKLDARAYNPNLKNLQNDITKNYREGEIAGIQSSVLRKQAWEKEHEKFKETNPEYYNHARSKFMADYISSGGNSLVRGWQGEGLARPIDVEKVTQHAYKLMAEKTGWTRDTVSGQWINSNGHKVESLEANRVFQNIMGTILADPANQAFMRQSTRLGYMRYLDDKGNIDYNSPGLNPYNSIAQSIAYKHDQKDHSTRENKFTLQANEFAHDKEMEEIKHRNAKKLKQFEKELEEPPIVEGITTIESDTAHNTLEKAIADANSGDDTKAQIAKTNIENYLGSELAGLGFAVAKQDKNFYKGLVNHVIKNGLVDGNFGKTVELYTQNNYGGTYYNQSQKERLSKEYNTKSNKLNKELKEIEKDYKAGKISKEKYELRTKYTADKIVKLSNNMIAIRNDQKQTIGYNRDGIGGIEQLGDGKNDGMKRLDFSSINSTNFGKRTTVDTQLPTVTVGKNTSSTLRTLINANPNSIKAFDTESKEYVDTSEIVNGEIVQATAGYSANGDMVFDVQKPDGSVRKIKIRSDNPNVKNTLGTIVYDGIKGKNVSTNTAVSFTEQGRQAAQYFGGTQTAGKKSQYGLFATKSLGRGVPVGIVQYDGKFKVVDFSNGKLPQGRSQNDVYHIYNRDKSAPVFNTYQEALAATSEL